uniref:Uncharacterized protein n=1 Tax=Avena sativa TaxID=4498 RepID=A0ACD5ZAT2_AVESA
MPTSSSTPPAPATPAATATPRRRRRRLLPSSSTSASPSSSPFSFFPPSPSPFHRFLPSPLRASTVPFSWEHRPGIPKTPARARSSKAGKKPLPLPPSLLCRSDDPYDPSSVVPVEYAALPGGGSRAAVRLGRVRVRRRRQRVGHALAEWLSVFSLYRSCKRAASCLAAKLNSP